MYRILPRVTILIMLLSLLVPYANSSIGHVTSGSQQSPQEIDPSTRQEIERLYQAGLRAFQAPIPDYPAAEKAWSTLLDKVGDDPRLIRLKGQLLHNLGAIYLSQDRLTRASDYLGKAKQIRSKLRHIEDLAETLINLGVLYRSMGQFDTAADNLKQALTVYTRLKSSPEIQERIADTHLNLSAAYWDLGLFEESVVQARAALDGYKTLGNAAGVAGMASSLENIGLALQSQALYDEAAQHFERAREIILANPGAGDVGRVEQYLADVLSDLGRFPEARDHAERSLAAAKPGLPADDLATRNMTLGAAYFGAGDLRDYRRAAECCDRAVKILKTVASPSLASHRGLARAMANRGQAYLALNSPEAALRDYRQADALFKQIGAPSDIAQMGFIFGNLYFRLHKFGEASGYLHRALLLAEPRQTNDVAFPCYRLLGIMAEQQGRTQEAIDCFSKAIACFESVVAGVSESDIGLYQEAYADNIYARCAAALIKRASELKSKKIKSQHSGPVARHMLEESFALVERGRARGLARLIARNPAILSSRIPSDEAKAYTECLKEMSSALGLLKEARKWLIGATEDKPAATTQFENALERVETAKARLANAQKALSRYLESARLIGLKPPTFQELEAIAAKNPSTLYLEWAVVEKKRILLYALSHKDGLRVFPQSIDVDSLERLTERWRDSITVPAQFYTKPPAEWHEIKLKARSEPRLAARISRIILTPLEKSGLLRPGRYTRIVIVADGPLLEVPFVALPDQTGKRLVDRYAMSTRVALGMSNWPEEGSPRRLSLFCVTASGGLKAGTFHIPLRGAYDQLLHAPEEARKIARLYPSAEIMVGRSTKKSIIKQRLIHPTVIQFITHGSLDSRIGLRSGLVLAPERPNGAGTGVLEAREILALRLSAQMVVLSACDTGLGQRAGGEGLLGLVWAFRAAGCPSAVASLWKVDDEATVTLMYEFHKRIVKGWRKDDALQAAMRAVRKAGKWSSPFYWASFEIVGNAERLSRGSASRHAAFLH